MKMSVWYQEFVQSFCFSLQRQSVFKYMPAREETAKGSWVWTVFSCQALPSSIDFSNKQCYLSHHVAQSCTSFLIFCFHHQHPSIQLCHHFLPILSFFFVLFLLNLVVS